jgi:hypothetical protein
VLPHPEARPIGRSPMDNRSVADATVRSHDPEAHDQAQAHEEQEQAESRPCFYCHMGRVCIGSLTHDGEEIVEVYRCRRCQGSGVLTHGDQRGGDAIE